MSESHYIQFGKVEEKEEEAANDWRHKLAKIEEAILTSTFLQLNCHPCYTFLVHTCHEVWSYISILECIEIAIVQKNEV